MGCDAVTSTSGLACRILQIIKVTVAGSETPITAMYNALKDAPLMLLLLDNFEMIWEAESDHSTMCDLLQKIAICLPYHHNVCYWHCPAVMHQMDIF